MLDLFDVVVTGMFSDAKAAGQKDRLGSIRDLDAAAMKLKQACVVLLDDTTSNAGVRPAVFSLISRAELAEAISQIDNLARPDWPLLIAYAISQFLSFRLSATPPADARRSSSKIARGLSNVNPRSRPSAFAMS